jgi:hypothetical protein
MYADNPKVAFYDKVLIEKAPTPDFGGDLNEMRRAEKHILPLILPKEKAEKYALTEKDKEKIAVWQTYVFNLMQIIARNLGGWDEHFLNALQIQDHASAAEKREAFLKALKLI